MKLPDVNTLLQQEVSRKEFLRYMGLAFLSLIGITGILNNLDKLSSKNAKQKEINGYGSSAYGR